MAAAQQQQQAAALGVGVQPAAASAMLQPTPPSGTKPAAAMIKLEQLGSSALPTSSGNGATLMETMALAAGAPGQQRGTAAASLPPGLPTGAVPPPAPTPGVVAAGVMSAGGTELSTGLTPHVGGLELPPGIEGIVPSNQPLTGEWNARERPPYGCTLAVQQQKVRHAVVCIEANTVTCGHCTLPLHPTLRPPTHPPALPAGDPASLQAAAAMGPVISIPAGTASEGLVVSGSSA
jgi:hypothetical protein